MDRLFLMVWLLIATPVAADTLVASRTVRAQAILTDADLATAATVVPGALTDPQEALGLEARVTLYAGRPIRPADVGPPAVIDRNQIVPILFRRGGLAIMTEGRALERGGVGDLIRVMNLSSKNSLTARVLADGSVLVE